jgi:predicted phosphodiesterase
VTKQEMTQLAIDRGVAFAAYQSGVKQSTIERYLREAGRSAPVGGAVSRGILFTDVHLAHHEEEHGSYTLLKQFAKEFKPDWVVNLGDWHDFGYLSSFAKNDELLKEGMRVQKDVELGNADLDVWQSMTDEYIMLQGNHDERLDRFVEASPAFEWLLSAEKFFSFTDRGIKYLPVREQPYKRGKLNMVHGWFANRYHARSHLDRMSGNIVYGHVHEFQTQSRTLVAIGDEIAAWSLGCLCDKAPAYAKGRPTEWQNGFAVVYMDEYGNFNLYPVRMIGNSFIFEGKRYSLRELARKAA